MYLRSAILRKRTENGQWRHVISNSDIEAHRLCITEVGKMGERRKKTKQKKPVNILPSYRYTLY